ncbi:DUF2934 domain-containing protein [Rhizobium sp. BE258]|uniref:DUF2934 domain-containing protein n=1 Tax=Rhizobium sp. BE258 TaxID=2817722 RepID=UPI0028628D68|nr:DUF2934 domain-containing protein [Rhizobium sp. BE258]MDR7144908.1 hypothetical protein [Rhizobium sp. BE258]
MDKDQERRERAYRIWEDEGRPHGKHDDHWQRAEDQHVQAKPMRTEANKHASEEFNDKRREKSSGAHARPPSMAASD